MRRRKTTTVLETKRRRKEVILMRGRKNATLMRMKEVTLLERKISTTAPKRMAKRLKRDGKLLDGVILHSLGEHKVSCLLWLALLSSRMSGRVLMSWKVLPPTKIPSSDKIAILFSRIKHRLCQSLVFIKIAAVHCLS